MPRAGSHGLRRGQIGQPRGAPAATRFVATPPNPLNPRTGRHKRRPRRLLPSDPTRSIGRVIPGSRSISTCRMSRARLPRVARGLLVHVDGHPRKDTAWSDDASAATGRPEELPGASDLIETESCIQVPRPVFFVGDDEDKRCDPDPHLVAHANNCVWSGTNHLSSAFWARGESQRDGNFVAFAGAGVSRPPPSSPPDVRGPRREGRGDVRLGTGRQASMKHRGRGAAGSWRRPEKPSR